MKGYKELVTEGSLSATVNCHPKTCDVVVTLILYLIRSSDSLK
ncbi:hypothetical protein BH10CHL1_BH10CHL1_49330 [soil metagenome]